MFGLFGAIASGIGSLFSSTKSVEGASNALVSAADKIIFTDEEKSDANLAKLNAIIELHKNSTGSRVARRIISIAITSAFLILLFTTAGLAILGASVKAKFVLSLMESTLGYPMSGIIVFYFGSGIIRDKK